MPLTPSDVAKKQFKVAFRGYALDEVDAFLDEVESEITRLLRERDELRRAPAAAPAAAASAPESPTARAGAGLEGQEAALRTLLLAQRTADDAVAEARAEAAQIVEAARAEADATLTAARGEAESTLAAAREHAARADAEINEKVQTSLGTLEERRALLERHIDDLRTFEREYRSRLRAHLQAQLEDLEERRAPEGGGAGVPAAQGVPSGPDGPHAASDGNASYG